MAFGQSKMDAEDKEGRTALDEVVKAKQWKAYKVLIEAGAQAMGEEAFVWLLVISPEDAAKRVMAGDRREPMFFVTFILTSG